MAPVEVKLFFRLIGVWGRGDKAPGVCGERMGCNDVGVGYGDAAV